MRQGRVCACDSVWAVMSVPTTEKQSVRPEYTAHSNMHAEQCESDKMAKARGQSD